MEQVQIAKNILSNVSQQSEIVEKSHIIDNFRETFLVDKSGREIKEKILVVLQKEQEEISKYNTQLETLKIKIGEDPTENTKETYYYLLDGFEDKVGDVPFHYKEKGVTDITEQPIYTTDKPLEAIWETKREYNCIVRKLVDCMIEIAMINTVLNSYPDNKMYKLTLREATILGF